MRKIINNIRKTVEEIEGDKITLPKDTVLQLLDVIEYQDGDLKYRQERIKSLNEELASINQITSFYNND